MRNRRTLWIVVLLLLVLLLCLLWRGCRRQAVIVPLTPVPPPPIVTPPPPARIAPKVPLHPVTPVPVTPPIKPPPPVVTPVVPPPAPPPPAIPPGQEGMHRELIPKNITIVRCYYDEEIVAPGETFSFDINGSGFTESFEQMISVQLDGLDLQVENLRLITANQIHGQIQVGSEATTQYNYPVVIIRNLPVFKAPEAFGVVRPGEVLDILLTKIDETGQFGKFQVITNLTDATFPHIRIAPTTPKLEVSSIAPQLPFRVNGSISIAPGLSSGHYGLIVTSSGHELFRKDPLVDVVKPDVGRTGSVESLHAVDAAHRPGDTLTVKMTGSGFSPSEAAFLTARVDGFDMPGASFTWLSQGRIDFHLPIPMTTPEGVYGMTILDKGKQVYQKKTVFGIVPPNWLAGVRLAQPLAPGHSGVIQILGRAISPEYVRSVKVETDEPGLVISNIRWQDPSTIALDVQVAPTVATGDYLLHVSAGGKALTLPQGSIIKVTP